MRPINECAPNSVLRDCAGTSRFNRVTTWSWWAIWLVEVSVVYTVGVGEDIRFDLALIARLGCTIYAMDPVPRSAEYARAAAAHEPRFIFHQLALWSRDETLTFHAPRQPGYVSHSAVNLFGTEEAFQA